MFTTLFLYKSSFTQLFNKKINALVYGAIVFVFFTSGCSGELLSNVVVSPNPSNLLKVHYIDVGQGDATLLQGLDFTILIDAGRHDANDVVPYLKSVGVTDIDLVVGTHPHADHIGQLDKVIENFNITEVWMSGDLHTSKTFERTLDAILQADIGYHEPRMGETFVIGSSFIEVLNPVELTGDLHEGSISLRITYGDIKFMFTGDAEEQTERLIINNNKDIEAHIFQLGHHGSRTSNTQAFLDAVNPDITIYSAGYLNSYGHPHNEVVTRIEAMNIPLYGTDIHGTIILLTNGRTYDITTEKDEKISLSNEVTTIEGEQFVCIDINEARKSDLEKIAHIGDLRADQLIELRPFESISDLTRINGIGSARIAEIEAEGLACVQ